MPCSPLPPSSTEEAKNAGEVEARGWPTKSNDDDDGDDGDDDERADGQRRKVAKRNTKV
jgi:hypothetical protein